MKLFIETSSGRLQNLYLLQDVRVIPSTIEDAKYAVGYIQENGYIVEDERYNTYEEADAKVQEIKSKLLEG